MYKVFVYGTLRRGEGNHMLLQNSDYLGEDSIQGSMFNVGYYPAVILGNGGIVEGELYEVEDPTLNSLDALEGVPHLYTRETVVTDGGEEVYTYQWASEVGDMDQIVSGNWIER